jgi:hypothetical protein
MEPISWGTPVRRPQRPLRIKGSTAPVSIDDFQPTEAEKELACQVGGKRPREGAMP